MTLMVDSMWSSGKQQIEQSGRRLDNGERGVGRPPERDPSKADRMRPSFNADRCSMLLEEPAISLWAAEAATDYGVTAVDALELLAYALFVDGQG